MMTMNPFLVSRWQRCALRILVGLVFLASSAHGAPHPWEKVEIVLTAGKDYPNPCVNVKTMVAITLLALAAADPGLTRGAPPTTSATLQRRVGATVVFLDNAQGVQNGSHDYNPATCNPKCWIGSKRWWPGVENEEKPIGNPPHHDWRAAAGGNTFFHPPDPPPPNAAFTISRLPPGWKTDLTRRESQGNTSRMTRPSPSESRLAHEVSCPIQAEPTQVPSLMGRNDKILHGVNHESLTSRERVNRALRFQRPDRTPRDFAAVPAVWKRLEEHFGVTDRRVVLQRLGVDCRVVSL